MAKTLAQAILYGPYADLPLDNDADPATGTIGRLYITSDTYEIYRDDGTDWDLARTYPAPHTHSLSAATAPSAAVDLAGQKLTTVGTPTAPADAATKAYTDGAISSAVGPKADTSAVYGIVAGQIAGLASESFVADAIAEALESFEGGGSGETFGVVFLANGDVALRGDGMPVTKRY